MINQPQQHSSHDNNDEIDLFALFSTLWQEKLKIISITLVFMLFSLVYALNATEIWSVSVTVDTPTPQQVKQYNFTRELINEGIRTLNKNIDAAREAKTSDQVINIDNSKNYNQLPSIEALHYLYVKEARMTTNQVKFFKAQPLFKAVVAENQFNQVEQNNYAYEWVAQNISFTAEDIKKVNFNNNIGTNITISAIKPEDALVLNQSYLDFINDIMMERLRDLISTELSFGLQQMVNFNDNISDSEKIQLEEKINDIEINIKIAKRANIKNFVTQNISLESAPDYTKGYEILSAEKFVLSQQLANHENNAVVNSNALLIEKWLNYDKTMQLDNFNFYRFTDEPKLPKTRDKPKRALILVLGTLLGLMLGVAYVLIMSVIRNHNKTKEA
ncbi:O-antigen chain length determinant protein [Moritella sp. JT01]|uniref:LPS O-antigen chain length determinant protein WzzB n=1 Tax=Moritella sp. JT01 TaxID=756698 RepID=UPI00079392C6|nr:Wzz/FepE/Etk N-terminal domain-containing protein [Moritella sp. JT01]KXO13725.1 O-antigen chain length determinant protein [Moritella sp. JT01]